MEFDHCSKIKYIVINYKIIKSQKQSKTRATIGDIYKTWNQLDMTTIKRQL